MDGSGGIDTGTPAAHGAEGVFGGEMITRQILTCACTWGACATIPTW
jgi:hypothetical protein